jgi:hypothetical protein
MRPIRDIEKGGLKTVNANRDMMCAADMTKLERMDILTEALGRFVDDGQQERGNEQVEETVWDVSSLTYPARWLLRRLIF